MTLKELGIGQSAMICKVGGEGALRQHFLDMGMIPGAEITVVKFAPMGDPMELQIHGYELTLRLAEADQIEVEPIRKRSRSHEGRQNIKASEHPGLGEEGKYHSKEDENPLPKETRLTYALVGNQNCGKTTLFNQLTGANQHVGNFPGVAFTKLGGEYALVFDEPFKLMQSKPKEFQNYLFIDLIDSTGFISKNGRNKLVELMTGIKNFIETECEGELEGYREGGDDFIARFPSKDLAIRAGLDSAWFALDNGAKIRAGIGRSRREAGERAQLVDSLNSSSPLSLVVFELANGLYAYNIPSEFSRTIIDLIENQKGKLIGIFAFVFIFVYVLSIFGLGMFGFVGIVLALIYAVLS